MSRSFAARDSSVESFSSIVERLSRKIDENADPSAGEDNVSIASDVLAASRRAPVSVAGSKVASTRQPTAAWKPARKGTGTSELSYEAALRKHSRNREAGVPAKKASETTPNSDSKISTKGATGFEKMSLAALEEDVAAAQASQEVKAFKPAQKDRRQPETQGSLTSESDGKRRHASAKGGRNRGVRPAGPACDLKVREERNHSAEAQARPVPRGKDSAKALSVQSKDDSQKRSTISIRLSEQEAAVLRQRADESCLSVSAYMRSCVMEAEVLRAQVKQALAELRVASIAQSSMENTKALPALTSGGTTWYRFWTRSASYVFGPWFSAGRRADTHVVAKSTMRIMYGE